MKSKPVTIAFGVILTILFLVLTPSDTNAAACVYGEKLSCTANEPDYCSCEHKLWSYFCDYNENGVCTRIYDKEYFAQCDGNCEYSISFDSEHSCEDVGGDFCIGIPEHETHTGWCCVMHPPDDDPPPPGCDEDPPPAGCDDDPPGGGGDPPPSCNDSCSCSNYTCPAGSDYGVTGSLCEAGNESCQCTTGCGNLRTQHGSAMCYYPETNTLTPDSPTHVSLRVAGFTRDLTTVPTLIPRPLQSRGETAEIILPSYPGDSTGARAVKYSSCFNNIGPYEWDDWSNPWRPWTNPEGEDLCTPAPCDGTATGLNNTSNFAPPGQTMYDVLTYGARGISWNEYRFVNQCEDSCTYSHDSPSGWTGGEYLVSTDPTFADFEDLTDRTEDFLGCVSPYHSSTRLNYELDYSVEVTDVDGASNLETIAVWWSFSNDHPPLRDLAVGGTVGSTRNDMEFGFMVEKARNADDWRYIFVPRYQPSESNPYIWWRPNWGYRVTDTNEGFGVTINGPNGEPTAIIRNVEVIENGENATLNFRLILLHEVNWNLYNPVNQTSYEQIRNGNYTINFAVGDEFQYMSGESNPGDILINRVVPPWVGIDGTQYLLYVDFVPPQIYVEDLSIISSQELNFNWRSSETSGVTQSGFKKLVLDSNYTPLPVTSDIANITPGHERDYSFAPNLVDLINYDSTHLWTQSTAQVGDQVEEIDLLDMENGTIGFYGGAFDNACNFSRCTSSGYDGFIRVPNNQPDSYVYTSPGACVSQPIGETWTVTRGGHVYSGGGYDLAMYPITPTYGTPASRLTLQGNVLWNDPYRIQVHENRESNPGLDDIKLSTGLLFAGNNNFQGITDWADKFRLSNYPASQDHNTGDDFEELVALYQLNKERSDARMENKYFELEYGNDSGISASIQGSSTNPVLVTGTLSETQCDPDYEYCIYRPANGYSNDLDLEILPGTPGQAGFICNRPTVIFVSGDLIANPNIIRSGVAANGCLFIVDGDVTINPGHDRLLGVVPRIAPPDICYTDILSLDCYPMYDRIEAFVLSDRTITILEDSTNPLDPLASAVNDGLHVRGALIAKDELINDRNLRLIFNSRFPSLVVHAEPLYYQMVRDAIGMYKTSYTTDIGFK